MWNRKEVKQKARTTLKTSYWRVVLVCFVVALFAGSYGLDIASNAPDELQVGAVRAANNAEIVDEVIRRSVAEPTELIRPIIAANPATKGILAGVFNHITASGSMVFGVLNAINQFVFGDQIMSGVVLLLGAAIIGVYWYFVGNVLRVGGKRFFLEARAYPGTKAGRMLFIYKVRKTRRVAQVMLARTVFYVLWCFTVVRAFTKGYGYMLIPYLLADNPTLSRKEVFRLSQQLMRGNKWRAFVLDLSFFPWYVLNLLSFGLLSYFFISPYKEAAQAEMYMALREKALANDPALAHYFKDTALDAPAEGAEEYPIDDYFLPEHPARQWLGQDYKRDYSPTSIILLFFAFCVIGWCWEVFVDIFNTGTLVNRGVLYGPWLPLYGSAGVLILLLFKPWRDNVPLTFVLTTAFCGALEFVTSWVLEAVFHKRWWDYSGYFLNIQGRVCLEGLLVFGLAGCLGIYLLAPPLDKLFTRIPHKGRLALCTVLLCLFATDLVTSFAKPDLGEGLATDVSSLPAAPPTPH